MKTTGVIYDAGTVYGNGLISVSTRLAFDHTTTRRELEISEPSFLAWSDGADRGVLRCEWLTS
jgi:hypothetical protein